MAMDSLIRQALLKFGIVVNYLSIKTPEMKGPENLCCYSGKYYSLSSLQHNDLFFNASGEDTSIYTII